jgi:serine/threonine protein kinase
MKMIQDEPIQFSKLNVSSQLLDVLKKCLEKDPVQRITYEELILHPFWHLESYEVEIEDLKKYKIPSEPQFDSYLRNRGIDPGQYRMHKQGLTIPTKQP